MNADYVTDREKFWAGNSEILILIEIWEQGYLRQI